MDNFRNFIVEVLTSQEGILAVLIFLMIFPVFWSEFRRYMAVRRED